MPIIVTGSWRTIHVLRGVWCLAKVRQVRKVGWQGSGPVVWTRREFRVVWRVCP